MAKFACTCGSHDPKSARYRHQHLSWCVLQTVADAVITDNADEETVPMTTIFESPQWRQLVTEYTRAHPDQRLVSDVDVLRWAMTLVAALAEERALVKRCQEENTRLVEARREAETAREMADIRACAKQNIVDLMADEQDRLRSEVMHRLHERDELREALQYLVDALGPATYVHGQRIEIVPHAKARAEALIAKMGEQ